MADEEKNINVSINEDAEGDLEPALSWNFPEYVQHHHSRRWWIWFVIANIVLLIYALLAANFLFALIVIIISGIIIFRDYHGAENITCAINDLGIQIDERLYEWNEMENFWFAYEPPEVKDLYINFKSFFQPILKIPLEDQNPLAVREFLSQYIEEDLEKEGQTTSEALGRRLKL